MTKFLFSAFFTVAVLAGFAQPKKVLADKIIATLGDKVILRSEIEGSINEMRVQNVAIPDNAGCLLLEQGLGLKALVYQAEADSLPVSDEEIDGEIDNRVRYYIQQYGSKEILEQIAGKSLFQLKEDFKDGIRDQLLARNMRNKIVEGVRITPAEVKVYFEGLNKDSLAFYESEIEVGQIVLYPKASRDLEMYAIEQLKEFKQQVESGSKQFKTLASLYTDDPGSKENGGQYDINRNEKQWDPVFLAKAFSLKEGQVSSVFKTNFGYHIIQMVSRNGDDASIRHILKVPQITSTEIKASRDKLDSIRAMLIAGTMRFGDAVSKFSEDKASKFTGGMIPNKEGTTFLTIDQLDKALVLMLKDLKIGQYSQPTEYADERGTKGVRIVLIINRTQPHRENLVQDYSKVAARALEEKKNNALEKWFNEKIPNYYVEIDPAYSTCDEMQKWLTARK